MAIMEFMDWLEKNHWIYEENQDSDIILEDITNRYKAMDAHHLEFLQFFKYVISPDEQTWFLCCDNYNGISEAAFQWNEFELLSLEAAEDDTEWREEIIEWWDGRLPIVMSVKNGYSFYAIDFKENINCVVRGVEPEFEEVEIVSDNFLDFLKRIMTGDITF